MAECRAWYEASFSDFLLASPESVIGRLTTRSTYAVTPEQRDAWRYEIAFLQGQLSGLEGTVCLEFSIPRMGRRIDAVLLTRKLLFVLEFKVGETHYSIDALNQVWDYALDLKYFHKASHQSTIVPVLIATSAEAPLPGALRMDEDGVVRPSGIDPAGLREFLERALTTLHPGSLEQEGWSRSPYLPTPTIVQAARGLYARHSVEEIARSDAGARNLAVTSRRVEELADRARNAGRKVICFVTGVPGAGKTLVGLNVATRNRDETKPTHAVFLSGNGPLVQVLSEALARDEVARRKAAGEAVRKGKVRETIRTFIQNVHHFRDEGLATATPAADHVVIFDEAQRAWNLRMTANFMKRKKKRPGFDKSEPEFLIEYMDRHPDWALVVCLVGGGQEINMGEAGIAAWLEAVLHRFPGWDMHISSRLTDSEYAAGHVLDMLRDRPNTVFDDALHLATSMRSFRAENVSAFVKAVLDCEAEQARRHLQELSDRYPIVVTRNLALAKQWIREKARGTERFGLVASSKAQRLRPHAIDVRVKVDPVTWFLNDRDDVRSSYYLEDAATEYQVQGLELDWACVTWDGDLRRTASGWSCHDFRGDRWINVKNRENREYLRNAYRVLLTRARQGMAIFVPTGNASDPTRPPEYYDETFDYLAGLGLPVLT